MLRRLYDWTMSLARTRHAERALAGVSFVESSFFPIPPDVLLIPMVLSDRLKWLRYALICTIASVAGALLGYLIGALLYDTIGQRILAFYHAEDAFARLQDWYDTWGGWGVLFAAVTPFPYKVLTIFSGFAGLDLVIFVLVSVVGSGAALLPRLLAAVPDRRADTPFRREAPQPSFRPIHGAPHWRLRGLCLSVVNDEHAR
jgi:membrane protein YqaA with SNARE-associated domain